MHLKIIDTEFDFSYSWKDITYSDQRLLVSVKSEWQGRECLVCRHNTGSVSSWFSHGQHVWSHRHFVSMISLSVITSSL